MTSPAATKPSVTVPDGPAPTLDDDGVWGDDPRGATAEEGAQMLRLFVDRVAADVRAALDALPAR